MFNSVLDAVVFGYGIAMVTFLMGFFERDQNERNNLYAISLIFLTNGVISLGAYAQYHLSAQALVLPTFLDVGSWTYLGYGVWQALRKPGPRPQKMQFMAAASLLYGLVALIELQQLPPR